MKKAEVIVFDVGFGDAIFIKIIDENNDKTIKSCRSFLIDCGYPGKTKECLDSLYAKNCDVDYLILTHKHSDHIAGAESAITDKRFNIKNVIMRTDDLAKCKGKKYRNFLNYLVAERPDFVVYDLYSTKVGEILEDFTVLYPEKENHPVSENQNKNSIVLALNINDNYSLFMGDATSAEEKIIIKDKKIDFAKVTYVKIGHHGSKTSTGKKFARTFKYGVIKKGIVSCKFSGSPPPHYRELNMHWKYDLEFTEDENVCGEKSFTMN